MDKLKQLPKKLLEIWNKYTRKQKTIIISTVAVVVVALVILVLVINKPSYSTLTQCSSYNEMSQVTKLLTDNSIEYTVDDSTMVVKVNKSDLTNAKMILASGDIKTTGYSLEDALKSSFSTTESDKQKQWQSYLETKFANDLSSVDGVKSASVTVVLGESTNTFYATKSETSISVVLDLNQTIDDDTASGMAQFLATAVGNSNTDKITIISTDGQTLFSGSDSTASTSGTNVSLNSQQKYKAQIETTMKNSLKQSLLATGLFDDAYVTTNLVMNWDAVNKIATEYTAQEGRDEGLYSESYVEKSENGGTSASGVPGTTSNDNTTTYDVSDGTSNTSKYSVEKYSYLPNELVTTTTQQPGSLVYDESSLTVTFIKNVTYNEDESKKLGYLDGTTWDEFKANNSQPTAIDVDDTWLTAISNGTGVPTGRITVLAYQKPFFVDSTATPLAKTLTFWVQIVLAILILGLLIFVILRSAKPLTVEEKEPELSVEEMLATTKENQPALEDIDLQEKSETRKAIEKFVDENPEAVALLLRNWLNDRWE